MLFNIILDNEYSIGGKSIKYNNGGDTATWTTAMKFFLTNL